MMSLVDSTGSDSRRPMTLAIAGHKGGTGRTTVALALAWIWGQQGRRTVLVDADPTGAASLIAADEAGVCRWRNVRLVTGRPDPAALIGADIVVIDCPNVTETAAVSLMREADRVALVCPPETLAVRTLSAVSGPIRAARAGGRRPRLLGLIVTLYDDRVPGQVRLLEQLRRIGKPPLLGSPIPVQKSLREWPLQPGSAVPSGPGRAALLELAQSIEESIEEEVCARS